MTRDQFIKHLKSLSDSDKVEFINQFSKNKSCIDTYLRQYDPLKHDIFDKVKRKDKPIRKPVPGVLNQDGTQYMVNDTEPVARIAIDAQQDITKNASGILCANKIELESANDASKVKYVWDANKLDLATIRLCNIWLSETEVAEIWYKSEEGELKYISLANSNGDKMAPVFDEFGKMICFGRSYVTKEIIAGTETQDVTVYEIYLEKTVQRGKDTGTGVYNFDPPKPHGFSKIPVSYASRELPLWSNVQTSIEQKEKTISNLCDTNAYFGSPTAVVNGKIISYAEKGESGKILEIGENAKIEYLTWNQAPESIVYEGKELDKIIYNSTRTVQLTIENLKGLFGSAPSAYAIKLLFTPAHEQAAEHEEVFGAYIQRRINIISSFVGVEADSIKPKFKYYLPNNDSEEIKNIISAIEGGILSAESGIEQSPLTVDIETEKDRIKVEEKKAAVAAKVIAPSNGKRPVVVN